jgi:glycosyltransferase involved in cell wall biosynthesis
VNALTVVVPAYNEAQAVPTFLARLKEVLDSWGGRYEVIVVDDGSRDGTGAALAALAGSNWGRVITHERNRGYGESLKTGIANASHEEILITDADGTYDPGDIPKLLVLADNADMVVGARSGKGAQIPLVRRPAKWILRALANFLLETRIADLNSGLRLFRKSQAIPLFPILPPGFSFTTTITLAFLSRGRRVAYVPIGYHRRSGTSKIRPIRDTLNFTALILKTVIYFRPLRVFVPLSLLFLLSGAGLLTYWGLARHAFSMPGVLLLLTGVNLAAIGAIADLIVNKP